jgi:hypothetical protein
MASEVRFMEQFCSVFSLQSSGSVVQLPAETGRDGFFEALGEGLVLNFQGVTRRFPFQDRGVFLRLEFAKGFRREGPEALRLS